MHASPLLGPVVALVAWKAPPWTVVLALGVAGGIIGAAG